MTAFQHLFEGDTLLIAIRQWLPRLIGLVILAELDHLLHLVVTQLIAAGQKLADRPGDTFLLVHLRDQLTLIGFGVGRTEDFSHHILALIDSREPESALHTGLFGQSCLTAIVGKRHYQSLIGIAFGMGLDGMLHTGIELCTQSLDLITTGSQLHRAVVLDLGISIGRQHALSLADHRKWLSLSTIEQLRIVAQATARCPRQGLHTQLALRQRLINRYSRLLGLLQQGQILLGRLRLIAVGIGHTHHHLQRLPTAARKGQHRVGHVSHPLFNGFDLLHALRTADIHQQQSRHRADIVEATLAEGGTKHQPRQFVGSIHWPERQAVLRIKHTGMGLIGHLSHGFTSGFGAHLFDDGVQIRCHW